MRPDQLLAQYERVADAPDAIPRLRQTILDLAVRGKLVDQDPNDESAATLIRRVGTLPPPARYAKRSTELIPGNCGLSINMPSIPVPTGWIWVPLVHVARIESGHTPSRNRPDWWDGDVPWMGLVDARAHNNGRIFDTIQHTNESGLANSAARLLPEGTVCFSRTASVGYVVILDRPMATSQDFVNWVPTEAITSEWLQLVMIAERPAIDRFSKGAVHQTIYYPAWLSMHVALPPLAEQQRIVAKVDELMALLDRLAATRAAREAARDRLTKASLARLGIPDPATFRAEARFALETLTPLTTRPDQIKQLRQTILNLAVRGKLVEQDPNDEPASELLEVISKTRKKLYAEKRISKPKPLPAIDHIDLPFTVPPGWAWSMLGDLCYQVADGPHFSPQYVPPDRGVPFLSTRNVRLGGFDLSSIKYISESDHDEFCKRIKPELNDILYTKGGTTGIAKVNDLNFEFSVWVHLAVLRIEKERVLPRYVELALNSPHCYAQSQRYTRGISNFDLGLTRMIKITVPLPPLAEQHRIVAKVDALMALLDRLEASLATATTTRHRLLEALLHDALAPVEDHAAAA